MIELVVATRNQGKLREISRLLEGRGYRAVGLDAFPGLPEVVEDGDTFEANARKKAATVAELTGRLTLADDSGLVVEALDGRPGVLSARYAGVDASDDDNNRKLLAVLRGVPEERRKAAFRCVMALAEPDGASRTFKGELRGRILEQPRGAGGFGYDPLFRVDGHDRSLAELDLDVKNRISHRGQALKKLLAALEG